MASVICAALPGWREGAGTGLLTCLPLRLACSADIPPVPFDSKPWHFFHSFKCLRWILALSRGEGEEGERKKGKRQILPFVTLRENFHVGLPS